MAKHDTLDQELDALNEVFEAEDAEDAATPEVDPSQRNITTFDGFADTGSTPREIDGTPYADSLT